MNEWTASEDAIIRELAETCPAHEIATRLPGRSANAVLGRANRLGITLPRKPLATSPWTPEVTAEAVRLRRQGLTHTQIAERLGMTREAVKYKLVRFARETPIEGARMRGAREPHWPEARIEALKAAVANPDLTWDERAKLCNSSRSATQRRAQALGLYTPLDKAEQQAINIAKANAARLRNAQERRAKAPAPQPRRALTPRPANDPPPPSAKPAGHTWAVGTFNYRAPAPPKVDTSNDDALIAEFLATKGANKVDPGYAWGSVVPQYIGKSGRAA